MDFGGSLKNPIFRRDHEKPVYKGDFLKRGAWDSLQVKEGVW